MGKTTQRWVDELTDADMVNFNIPHYLAKLAVAFGQVDQVATLIDEYHAARQPLAAELLLQS